MAKAIVLTAAEFSALAAVDGTHAQPKMAAKLEARLIDLYLIERREWPYGPLWLTTPGARRVRAGK